MDSWDLIITDKLDKFLTGLPEEERAKVKSIFLLFKEYGRALPVKYLKRISGTGELWELRAKRVRVFFIISGNVGIAVYGVLKKTQKTPIQDIELAVKRAAKAKKELL